MKNKGKCETCEYFISDVTVIDEYGSEIWGYGCELGGSYLDKKTFWNGCKDFKSQDKTK